ncbi:dTDP-4-dehydrorhamnose reductase [Endozoicomonas sp. (ex Bugula neritina AB1)]|nr:dTDP-4-dehydrorhamnose reductase [Endozoicomonas sp. (ex Bugula neritina AB1)]
MKVLLIGGSGQIGRELLPVFQAKNIEYFAPTRSELDLDQSRQIDACLKQYKPDFVINTAGYNDPVMAENEPSRCFKINRDAVAELADCCDRVGAALIHISTYRVFDGEKKDPYTEKDTPNPTGVLATSRWQAEQQIHQRCKRHLILRFSWVISEHRNNLLRYLLNQITKEKEVAVVSDQLGCPTPAEDAAKVIVALIQQLNCDAEAWGTYHYAGAEPVSENSFAEMVIAEASQHRQLTIRKLKMDKVSDREGIRPPTNASLSCSKILNTFGVHNRPWRNTLSRIIRTHYLKESQSQY